MRHVSINGQAGADEKILFHTMHTILSFVWKMWAGPPRAEVEIFDGSLVRYMLNQKVVHAVLQRRKPKIANKGKARKVLQVSLEKDRHTEVQVSIHVIRVISKLI